MVAVEEDDKLTTLMGLIFLFFVPCVVLLVQSKPLWTYISGSKEEKEKFRSVYLVQKNKEKNNMRTTIDDTSITNASRKITTQSANRTNVHVHHNHWVGYSPVHPHHHRPIGRPRRVIHPPSRRNKQRRSSSVQMNRHRT